MTIDRQRGMSRLVRCAVTTSILFSASQCQTRERAAAERQEAAWAATSKADTIEAYKRFIEKEWVQGLPSHLVIEAGERIQELRRRKQFDQAVAAGTISAYEEFLAKHPEGASADRAKALLATLRQPCYRDLQRIELRQHGSGVSDPDREARLRRVVQSQLRARGLSLADEGPADGVLDLDISHHTETDYSHNWKLAFENVWHPSEYAYFEVVASLSTSRDPEQRLYSYFVTKKEGAEQHALHTLLLERGVSEALRVLFWRMDHGQLMQELASMCAAKLSRFAFVEKDSGFNVKVVLRNGGDKRLSLVTGTLQVFDSSDKFLKEIQIRSEVALSPGEAASWRGWFRRDSHFDGDEILANNPKMRVKARWIPEIYSVCTQDNECSRVGEQVPTEASKTADAENPYHCNCFCTSKSGTDRMWRACKGTRSECTCDNLCRDQIGSERPSNEFLKSAGSCGQWPY